MKKAKRLLALGAAAVMMMGAFAMPASAANTQNTDWGFGISSINTIYQTGLREKTNATGVYVHYESGSEAVILCDVLNSENQSETRGRIARISKGEEGLIAQYVYEDGFRWAKLQFKPTTAQINGGAYGEWSPDSVGSYPYLN